jgi:hypothetical protein
MRDTSEIRDARPPVCSRGLDLIRYSVVLDFRRRPMVVGMAWVETAGYCVDRQLAKFLELS